MSTTSPSLDELGPVSPELALVDPELRARLFDISQAATARIPDWATASREHLLGKPEEPVVSASGGARASVSPVKGRAISLTMLIAASLIAFVLGAKLAAPSSIGSAPSSWAIGSVTQMTPPIDPLESIEAGARELAWSRTAGARGYEVVIAHGNRTVFVARTTAPDLFLTPSQQAAIPRTSLTWYVWPLGPNGRAGPPVVQSKLVLDP